MIGLPNADFGEMVVAVVVPDVNSAQTLNEDTLLGQLDGSIARFKLPRRIEFVDELPRNTMGKVQKNVLREQFG